MELNSNAKENYENPTKIYDNNLISSDQAPVLSTIRAAIFFLREQGYQTQSRLPNILKSRD